MADEKATTATSVETKAVHSGHIAVKETIEAKAKD
jgi:hypothetical protein